MENNDDVTVDISEEEVISQQVFAISRLTPAMMMANIVNVIAVVLVLQITGQNRPVAVVWALVVSVFALYFLWKWFADGRRHSQTNYQGVREQKLPCSLQFSDLSGLSRGWYLFRTRQDPHKRSLSH